MGDMQKNKKWFLPKPLVLAAAGSLVVAVVFFILTNTVSAKLYEQQAAKYWQSGRGDAMPYTQVSVFLARSSGFSYDSLMKLRYDIDEKYVEEGITSSSENPDARLWLDAASAEGNVTITRGNGSVTAVATAVIGDYFRFHQPELMSGSYLNPEEASKDIVLLDWDTAWRLFGGYDIAGMQVEIGGYMCVVGGVFEKDKKDETENRIIMSYELYELTAGSPELSVLEFILPNPVSGYGLETVSKLVGVSEENRVVVENSSRFKYKSLFEAVTDFGGTISQSKSIALPYFENRARVAEFNGGVFLLLSVVFAILPVIAAVAAGVKIYRNRSKYWAGIKNKLKRNNERISDELQEIDGSDTVALDNTDDSGIVREGERE